MLDEALMINRNENKGNSSGGVVEEIDTRDDDDNEVDASIAYHQGRVLSKELRIQACLALGMLLPPHHIVVGVLLFFSLILFYLIYSQYYLFFTIDL